ncbi:phage tail tape measure protein [Enterobacter soli]|uniref:phage tail tape measure protein n=1 Tax=Enterobacter soli TaxID=885040 RepID=UPI002F407FB4
MARASTSSQQRTQQRTQLFLQSVKVGSTEIPREMISRVVYIEFADLSGPQLELEIRDGTNYLTDTLGVTKGTILTCSMGNPQGMGNTSWTDTFIVLKAPEKGDVVNIIAFSEKVKALKERAPAPKFFVQKQPATIVSALASAFAVDVDSFKKLATYHLNMSQKPSAVLARIAQEAGALCWAARGTIHVKGMTALSTKTASYTYEANNPKATYRINRFSKLNDQDTYLLHRQYKYTAYSATNGVLTAGKDTWPVKMVSVDDQTALNNMIMCLLPRFDMEVDGNSALTPGMPIKVLVHSYSSTSGLDESIPSQMVVERVVHLEDRFNYNCRVILAEVYDGK